MGGWDYYCFLCAAGFNFYNIEEDEDVGLSKASDKNSDRTGTQNPHPKALFSKDTMLDRLQWLSKFRTIGQNQNARGISQCYLTGPATEDEYGRANIQRGDHPNAQNLADDYVQCYRNGQDENADLPVHDNCFAILCKVFARAQDIDSLWTSDQDNAKLPFDLDALFSCLAGARKDFASYLELDHGFEPEQYGYVEWERIYDYFDPLPSPEVPLYAAGIVDPGTTESAFEYGIPSLFSSLPHEMLTQILDLLPPADLVSLIKASKVVYRATRQSTFWRRRLLSDAPWIWDYHGLSDAQNIHWMELYNSVMMQAVRPLHAVANGTPASGLANRRRIWHVCEQVLQMYLESNSLMRRVQQSADFEEGVVCRYMPTVAHQKFAQSTSQARFFFNDTSEMYSGKHIKLKWTADGALSGIALTTSAQEVTLGDFGTSEGTESALDIQADDWIEKMILNITVVEEWVTITSPVKRSNYRLAVTGVAFFLLSGAVTVLGKHEGCKRLLEPLPGNGIVGLKIQLAQGRITHLGLLEHLAGLTKIRPRKDRRLLDILWNSHLPTSDLRFEDYSTGYWTSDSGWDLTPMHLLMFGSTDVEQATITAFGAGPRLQCFEIHRSDGSCERIGSYGGPMKIFRIDGPGGERIAGFEFTIGHLPVGVTLVTTHDRQAVFGQRANNAIHGQTSKYSSGVAGLYCSFEYGSQGMGKGQLSSLGLIQSPHIARPPMRDDRLTDENGLLWEARPPPSTWHAFGMVHGPKNQGETAVCIDFSRPVELIDGLWPAPEWMDLIELGGFAIHYSDNNPLEPSSHLGFPLQEWPASTIAMPGLRSMKRNVVVSMAGCREVDTGEAHVLTDEEALKQPTTWCLGPGGGEKIVAVTVWAGDLLHGLQFHSESGKDSPRWGKCGGQPSGQIYVGGKDAIVGLKVILGTQRLKYNTSALSPQAVQAMSDARQ